MLFASGDSMLEEMNKTIEVSIICIVFNHKDYIRKCLDGMVGQITDFDYEIIIHDDCSTDGSKEIIEEYERNHPNIVTILQEENQYSKGKNITRDIVLPITRGKYVALCEGDDYWIDPYKLQKQFNAMRQNQLASMCVHNTIIHDLSSNEDKLFFQWKEEKILTAPDVIFGWNVHTSSYFMKKEIVDYRPLPQVWCGDYARLLFAFAKGQIISIPDIMSVYNSHNIGGRTYELKNISVREKRTIDRKVFLEEFNKYTDYKYSLYINKRICQLEKDLIFCNIAKKIKQTKYTELVNEIKKTDEYKRFITNASRSEKVKLIIQLRYKRLAQKTINMYFK